MNDYEDILYHPHHVSTRRPPMSMQDRAAQFSAFKALTGYEEGIDEAARVVEEKLELTADRRERLDGCIRILRDAGPDVQITLLVFHPDPRKPGGVYLPYTGLLRRVDEAAGLLLFRDGTSVPLRDIYDMYGEVFPDAL